MSDSVERTQTLPSINKSKQSVVPFVSYAERKYQLSPKHGMTEVRPPTGCVLNPKRT